VLVFRDVTKERRAEQDLRKAQEAVRQREASLRATLYSIGDGVQRAHARPLEPPVGYGARPPPKLRAS
jgi:hypothetical protein